MRVMRPVMSALRSTFFLGWIFPLAVTAATRSRVVTCSSRTSVPRSRLAFTLTTTIPTSTTRPAPPASTLFRFDMVGLSSFRLAEPAADGRFQRGHRLVVIVDGGDVVVLRVQLRHLRIEQLEERSRAHAVALGGELELLARGGTIGVLDGDR